MSSIQTGSKPSVDRPRYHPQAYHFVFDALQFSQERLGKPAGDGPEQEKHVSGQELLDGIRSIALERFGLMTRTVFRHWGIHGTGDFGRIVFELIERGEMRKTERDQLADFFEVYDFEDAFDHRYLIETRTAFG